MRAIIVFLGLATAVALMAPRSLDGFFGKRGDTAAMLQAASAAPTPAAPSSARSVTLRRDNRGHFQVEGRVDGRRLDFMVDTGASVIALRERDAAKLGIHPAQRDYTAKISTANGIVRAARVELNRVEIGGLTVRDVTAVVLPDEALGQNLLGMSFLVARALGTQKRQARSRTIIAARRDRLYPKPKSAISVARAFALWLCANVATRFRGPHVSQAKALAHSQHLCLRIRAAGEADRLSRIRRALAARTRKST